MSEWWTYGLSDFLMFSPRSYERLLAAHAAARWPAPPLALVAGLALIAAAATRRPPAARALLAALALAWAFVALDFLATRFARIHLGALPMAALFGLQALALAAVAWRGRLAVPTPAALGPALVVAIGYPLATAAIRPAGAVEWPGFTPDPTAALTLALLPALLPARWAAPLCLLPLATVAVGVATLHLLQWPAAGLPAVGVPAGLLAGALAARRRPVAV